MLNTAAVHPDEIPRHGTLVAPGLKAPIHHHVFCVRLDMSVDGPNNSVYEVDLEQEEDDMNPYGNAAYAKSTLLASEQSAQRLFDPFKARHWKIANSTKKNAMGYSTAFKLLPGENTLPTGKPNAAVMKRAEYMTKHLWVTPYKEDEMFVSGEYPNQSAGGEGIGKWTEADRCITDTDVVVWYTFAHAHIPRAEDWPVMPVGYIGFLLKPVNFFDQNPSNDVPATPKNASRMACCSMKEGEEKKVD
jgi:primary-amine oxidase